MTMHTTPAQIVLSKTQAATLKAAAETALPAECCGLLAGKGDAVLTLTEIIPTANVAEDPHHRFMIDPQVQFDLLRRLRGSGARVIGHYHSHPNGSAKLSRHDLAMATEPDAVWIVIAVGADGRALPPTAFICPDNQAPISIEIVIGA